MLLRDKAHKLWQLEREECFRRRINLNEAQTAWEDAYQLLKELQGLRCTDPMNFRSTAFYVAESEHSMRLAPWPGHRLIVPANLARTVFLSRVPTHPEKCHWEVNKPPRRRFRLNFLTSRFRVDSGELWVDPSTDTRAWQARFVQRDVAKQPIQDHPLFTSREYDPHGRCPGDPAITSPISGVFEIMSSALHVTLAVGGVPVVRFLPEDVTDMVTHSQDSGLAKPGSRVRKGEPLIRLTSVASEYGRVQWKDYGSRQPKMDVTRGDFLSGTREQALVGLASEMMRRVAMAARDEWEDIRSFSEWCPRHLVEFDAFDLEMLISKTGLGEWPQPARKLLLRGLSPNGKFCARVADFSMGTLESVTELPNYRVLKFGAGKEISLPLAAEIRPSICVGTKVSRGDAIAEWVPRVWYEWAEFAATKQATFVAREFVTQALVSPGTAGYTGGGACIDSRLIPSSWSREGLDHYLDFREGAAYLTEAGTLIGPPQGHNDWADWHLHGCGVGYNCEPIGDRLEKNAITF